MWDSILYTDLLHEISFHCVAVMHGNKIWKTVICGLYQLAVLTINSRLNVWEMLKNFVFIIIFVPYFEKAFDLSDQ